MGQPTIIDIAERAGVSKSLVSLVLRGSPRVSEASRRVVLDAAAALGYRPNAMARSLVSRRTNVLGVVLSDLHNTFFAEVLDGIDGRAREEGYRTLLATGHRSPAREAEAIEALLELRTEGLVLAGPRVRSSQIVEASRTVPVVVVSREVRGDGVDCVLSADGVGAAAAVDHLVSLGHRRIAHIDGGTGAGGPARLRGYLRAMERHGLKAEIRWERGDFTEEAGVKAVDRLLARGRRPTAIFAANDLSALGALEALTRHGLAVPDDVSLVGYDNTALARLAHVDLTTIDQPRREMGIAAAALLLERVAGRRSSAKKLVLAPSLVVGRTTAPPRARAGSD